MSLTKKEIQTGIEILEKLIGPGNYYEFNQVVNSVDTIEAIETTLSYLQLLRDEEE
ncbi:hypothetical protein M0R19_04910 [Candidatus Pacearchaeota archaeon]|jgi:hypothetical protein|nr:hypothetical protein [Candidatus Pacearchaeota archaeon]